MPQLFTLSAGSRDGLFSLSATASATFVGHDYSNSNTYRIDSLNGLINGTPIVSFVHDEDARIQDYFVANGIDTQDRDEFAKLVITDAAGLTYSITDLGRATYLEFDSRDRINGRYIGVQVTPVCFAAGTRLRTSEGDVAVEALRVGALAATAGGAFRPIRWLGHRDIDCSTLDRPHEVFPVRVAAGAFGLDGCGDAVPERDLRLSPGHPVLVGDGAGGEVLVPIMCLINGTSIARVPVASVTYWHVELDTHDILLAEGLPAESYLDGGDRAFFGEASVHAALADPDVVAPGLAGRCRPVALEGPIVEAERRRLDALFAMRLHAQSAWPTGDPDAFVVM